MSQNNDPPPKTIRERLRGQASSQLLSAWNQPIAAGVKLLGKTKKAILESLMLGDKTAEEMARMLDVNINAVRGHTDFLELEGFVQSRFEKARVGRPKKLYSITEFGRELFPRRYDVLLISLLNTLKSTDREEVEKAMTELAAGLGDEARASIKEPGEKIRNALLAPLVEILNEIGFRTGLEIDEDDGSARIVRTYCPVIKVARSDSHLVCELFDTTFLKSALGTNVSLVQTMARGSGRCVHSVSLSKARTAGASSGPMNPQSGRLDG